MSRACPGKHTGWKGRGTGLILRQGNGSGMGGLVHPEQTQQVPANAPSLKRELR